MNTTWNIFFQVEFSFALKKKNNKKKIICAFCVSTFFSILALNFASNPYNKNVYSMTGNRKSL